MTPMRGHHLALFAVLGLVGCKTTPASEVASSAEASDTWRSPSGKLMPRLETPEKIPWAARLSVSRKMRNHGDDMTVMLWAMLFLDFGSAGEIAEAIADEPKLARPLEPDSDDVNAMLPQQFYDLQDELRAKAAALVELSDAVVPEPDAFAKAFGELTATCVRCHTVYLHDR